MTKPHTQVPLRQRPIFTRSVVFWTTLGALSAGYLGILLLAPDWLDDLKPTSATLDPQSNHGQRAAARLASDINGLRDSVSQIQMDLAKIKTEVQGGLERDRSLAGQVAALEQKIASSRDNKIEAAAPPSDGTPAPTAKPNPANPEIIQADVAAPPAAAPAVTEAKVFNGAPNTSITTGQIVDPATVNPPASTVTAAAGGIDFGTAVVKPAPKPLGVKLSSGDSIDALRLSWSLLAERHGDALKNLQARYVAAGDPKNPSYHLIAGPIKSTAAAKKLCKTLAANNIPCTPGDFAGDTL